MKSFCVFVNTQIPCYIFSEETVADYTQALANCQMAMAKASDGKESIVVVWNKDSTRFTMFKGSQIECIIGDTYDK